MIKRIKEFFYPKKEEQQLEVSEVEEEMPDITMSFKLNGTEVSVDVQCENESSDTADKCGRFIYGICTGRHAGQIRESLIDSQSEEFTQKCLDVAQTLVGAANLELNKNKPVVSPRDVIKINTFNQAPQPPMDSEEML